MPNWIYNTITTSNDLLKLVVNENDQLDFNKIIPMPHEIKSTIGKSINKWSTNKQLSQHLIKKYGANNWYDWCLHNWGTKWNAVSDTPYDGNGFIEFRTPWSFPDKVILKLSQKFPSFELKVTWYDPSASHNHELFFIKNGVSIIYQ